MSGEAKRKFLKVSVDEVSLVDEPANESPIAVMKRKETDDMSTPAEATNKNTPAAQSGAPTPVTKDAGADVEHVDVEAEGSEDVLKRLTSAVEALVAKNTDGEDDVAKAKAKGKPPFMEDEETKTKKAALTAQLKKAGLSDKDIEKAVSTAFGVKKSADGDEVAATVTKDEAAMDVLEALGEVISKAKKFTPKRLAQLTEVTTKLQGLLNDLNSGKPDEGGDDAGDTGASVQKSKDGEAAPAAPAPALDIEAAIAKALKPVLDELETVKKTRTPSTAASTETDGAKPPVTTETTTKSFWSGVL